MAFSYTPTDGLLNSTSFPNKPASNAAARQQFQELFNQVRDYINDQSANVLIPVGSVFMFFQNTVPAGFLELKGQAVSRVTYQTLWGMYGTTYGAGDGSTTFNLPDMRANFARGWDNGRGVDSGRTLGSYQADYNKSHFHELYGVVQGTGTGGGTKMVPAFNQNLSGWSWQTATRFSQGSGIASSGTEARPKNLACIFAVKF